MPTTKNTTNDQKTPARRPATPEELAEAQTLIESALEKGGAEALVDIRPIAFAAELLEGDAKDSNTLLRPSVAVQPVVNPLFDSVMLALGFERLGSRSYAIGAGAKLPSRIILAMLRAIPPAAVRARRAGERIDQNGFDQYASQNTDYEVFHELQRSPAGSKVSTSDMADALWGDSSRSTYGMYRIDDMSNTHRLHELITISSNGSQIIVTVATAYGASKKNLSFWKGAPDLNLMRLKNHRGPAMMSPAEATAAIESARAWGFPVQDRGGMKELRSALQGKSIVGAVAGSPGLSRIVIHSKAALSLSESDMEGVEPLGDSTFLVKSMTAFEAGLWSARAKKKSDVVFDPHIEDVIRMSKARPTGKRNPLRPYQDEAVSLHLATEFGYVNACAPGLGKTLMALRAQQEKAAKIKGYRSLVVCPAAIRSQWMGEARRFFPEAKIASWTAKVAEKKLDAFLDDAGDDPAIVFLSYDAMRGAADKLAEVSWNDLICDEAAILGSTGTGRTKALWSLRSSADVAVALTGTPINRSLDDLGYILAWARGDEAAFYGQKLSRRFNMASDKDVEGLWDSLGPTVFRRDRSEIADQLPHIETEVLTLDPEPSEKALANGARDELKKIYASLEEKLSVAEELRPDDPALKQAREDMKKIRGAVLGGVTLARMAASDPSSLLGQKSKSAGVALLSAAGLIDPAAKTGGTKRKLVVGLVDDLVQRQDAVLIFTDFSTVAENLASDLKKLGVRVGTFTGKNSGARRDKAAEDFQKGDLDCLVLTGAGREGLNLQRASVLIHFDLPWVPSQVVQRVGRASRFGSTADHLSVLIPIMAGTIEERVAALLVPRAVEALRALDSHRGVKGSETEVGLAIGGLEDAVSEDQKSGSLFDMAKDLFS